MNRGSPLRDVAFYLRGRLTKQLTRLASARDRTPPVVPVPLDEVIRGGRDPLALSRLLEGRSNAERESAVARYLGARGIPFVVHRFASREGSGDNFAVDLGAGSRVLLLAAHHDAVDASPGANDNAAAVGILLSLIERLAASPPTKLRLRFLFTAAEERGYLGARHYAREIDIAELAGVLSLELCGIGDSVVIWDAPDATPFLDTVSSILRNIGLARDEGHHVVGRIPMFGSDHRAFALRCRRTGSPWCPRRREALRGVCVQPGTRRDLRPLIAPVPFDTYHTPRDQGAPWARRCGARAARGRYCGVA